MELAGHLDRCYQAGVAAVEELDLGVYRVERASGAPWVARVFPATRPLAAVEGDAEILRRLERGGFPAERCADLEPVSSLEGRPVLVTEFVPGRRAGPGRRTFAVLGELLGRLHARTSQTVLRSGGGWHHMTAQGGPSDELEAARSLLAERRPRSGVGRAWSDALADALARADDAHGLPESLLHPDFAPANAIADGEGRLVVVDWSGAGRGPRLWSLAFLLWAAGAREIGLVDAVVWRYGSHVALQADEVERLGAVISAPPLVLASWELCWRPRQVEALEERIAATERLAGAIAERVRGLLAG